MLTRNRIAFAVAFVVLAAGVAGLSLRGDPLRPMTTSFKSDEEQTVTPDELASWIIEGRRDFTVVDMRPLEQYKKGHIGDAVSCGSCHESREEGRKSEAFVDLTKKVVLYAQSNQDEIVLPKILAGSPRLLRLSGGWEGWSKEILSPELVDGLKSSEAVDDRERRQARRGFFTGETPAAAAPAKLPVEPVRRTSPHSGTAAAAEGC